MPPTRQPDRQERLNLMLTAVDSAVIPLYALLGRRELNTIGSAVLVQTASGHSLVVTAGHVVDTAAGRGVFTMGGDATGLIQLRGDGFASVPDDGNRDSDKVDLAAFALDRETVVMLREAETTFLSEAVLSDESDVPATYAFAGFPLTINRFKREREPDGQTSFVIPHRRVIVYAKAADDAAYRRTRTDPKLNFVAAFKHREAQFYDSAKPGFPHPRGMSGGAVFRLRGTSATPFRSADVRLVGIGIEYHEKPGLLVAANARALRKLLRSF